MVPLEPFVLAMRVKSFNFCYPLFQNFNEAEKWWKALGDVFNGGEQLILYDLLNKRVAEGDISDPHDFISHFFF